MMGICLNDGRKSLRLILNFQLWSRKKNNIGRPKNDGIFIFS
jgi:hypothetical protein